MTKRGSSLCAVVLVALLGATLSGCRFGQAFGRAAGSLFASPAPVKKLTNPIDKNARLAVLWIGHATALVQMDDKLILTDPVFTSTVGQFSRRLVEPGFDADNLPALDAVLISHLHFDHLSLGSLDAIERKVRMLLMPPGGVTYLTDFGFPVLELRPWQAWEKDGLRVTAAPVDHVGYRYGLDAAWMHDGFTGYVVEYHGLKVYFGGDTGYDPKCFIAAGERFPNIDVALLPIGPIEPHDLIRHYHMDPQEAVQAFFDLGARRMVPIHYDTFVNSLERRGDALRGLDAAKKKWSLGRREIVPVAVGERRVFMNVSETPSPSSVRDAPAPATPARPAAEANIPDDDKLD